MNYEYSATKFIIGVKIVTILVSIVANHEQPDKKVMITKE